MLQIGAQLSADGNAALNGIFHPGVVRVLELAEPLLLRRVVGRQRLGFIEGFLKRLFSVVQRLQ